MTSVDTSAQAHRSANSWPGNQRAQIPHRQGIGDEVRVTPVDGEERVCAGVDGWDEFCKGLPF